MIARIFAIVIFALSQLSAAQMDVDRLMCHLQFFSASNAQPKDDPENKNKWTIPEDLYPLFHKSPLSDYNYFKKTENVEVILLQKEPRYYQFSFLDRYEINFLETHALSTGQVIYKMQHKIGHRRSSQFSLGRDNQQALFIQHAGTFDHYLLLQCKPD